MKKIVLSLLLLVTGIVPAVFAQSGGGTEISKTAQAAAFTQSIDVGEYERFSTQVDYTAVRPATSTVSGGSPYSATLTVSDYAGLQGTRSTATITLSNGKNTSAIDGAVITINGRAFTEGVDWSRLALATMTAAGLATVIDAWNTEYSASVSSNVITITAASSGTAANAYTITSSTGVLSASGSTFANGQAFGYFMLNYVTLTEGTDWNALTSSATTAGNIAAAINANATLAASVSASTTSLGVVTVVSLTNGAFTYPISVSNASKLVPAITFGTSSDISVSGNTFYEPAHGWSTGLAVLFSTTSNSTAPTGLTRETTYYAIPVDANYYKLASSASNAIAGTAIDITALASGGAFDIKPLAFATGSAGFKWQASNDGSDWADLSVSSVTYSADGTQLLAFTDYSYRYLRINFTGPTSGGLTLDGTLRWRK